MTEVVRRRRARGEMPTKAASPSKGTVLTSKGTVTVCVYGRPAPQGSKSPLGMEDNPRTKPWRAAIKNVCQEGLPAGFVPLDGSLVVDLWFFFAPLSSLAPGAMPNTRSTYDWDKLSRAAGDGLTEGGVIVDDARIVDAHVHKRYCSPDTEPRMLAVISPYQG